MCERVKKMLQLLLLLLWLLSLVHDFRFFIFFFFYDFPIVFAQHSFLIIMPTLIIVWISNCNQTISLHQLNICLKSHLVSFSRTVNVIKLSCARSILLFF